MVAPFFSETWTFETCVCATSSSCGFGTCVLSFFHRRMDLHRYLGKVRIHAHVWSLMKTRQEQQHLLRESTNLFQHPLAVLGIGVLGKDLLFEFGIDFLACCLQLDEKKKQCLRNHMIGRILLLSSTCLCNVVPTFSNRSFNVLRSVSIPTM